MPEGVIVGARDTDGLLISEVVGVIESVGVRLTYPADDSIGLVDSVTLTVPVGVPEPVIVMDIVGLELIDSVTLTVPVGVRESVGLGDRDPVEEDDSGTMPYEIENTGLPPAPAIGTPVGKTIVRVAFC